MAKVLIAVGNQKALKLYVCVCEFRWLLETVEQDIDENGPGEISSLF